MITKMARSDQNEQNPYASPRSVDDRLGQRDGEIDPNVVIIEASLPRRDWIDVGLEALHATSWGLLLAGVPGLVIHLLCLSASWWFGTRSLLFSAILAVGFPVWILSLMRVFTLYNTWMVSRVALDAAGIAFERRAGQPRFIRWSEIRIVRPATRREVFVSAWLWPWTWAREPSKTKSACGHYRIEWTDRYVFYPPRDPELFENAIRKFCPRLLGDE